MFIRPCDGRITSYFGRRFHPIHKKWMGHQGVDIAATGTIPIKTSASGTVSRVQPDKTFGTYGNLVMIVHSLGGQTWETVYAHLRSYSVKVGQKVKQGETIGYMGNTGGSTGQHLHFEIHKGRWNNQYTNVVNPLYYYKDPDVQRLQQMLVNTGLSIEVDGWFGLATQKAVEDFQELAGLVVDGSVGPATLAALDKYIPKKEVAAVSEPNHTPSPSHQMGWEWAIEKGYMNGERPKEAMTREQFASVMMKIVADLNKK